MILRLSPAGQPRTQGGLAPRLPDFWERLSSSKSCSQVEADFAQPYNGDAAQLAPVFTFPDDLHPNLWRGEKAFPASGPVLRDMLANLEADIALSFNPSELQA